MNCDGIARFVRIHKPGPTLPVDVIAAIELETEPQGDGKCPYILTKEERQAFEVTLDLGVTY